VRRGGDDFVDTARALCGTREGDLKRQPRNRWKWVSLKLESTRPSQVRDQMDPSVPKAP
jgi:hypothetical protein